MDNWKFNIDVLSVSETETSAKKLRSGQFFLLVELFKKDKSKPFWSTKTAISKSKVPPLAFDETFRTDDITHSTGMRMEIKLMRAGSMHYEMDKVVLAIDEMFVNVVNELNVNLAQASGSISLRILPMNEALNYPTHTKFGYVQPPTIAPVTLLAPPSPAFLPAAPQGPPVPIWPSPTLGRQYQPPHDQQDLNPPFKLKFKLFRMNTSESACAAVCDWAESLGNDITIISVSNTVANGVAEAIVWYKPSHYF